LAHRYHAGALGSMPMKVGETDLTAARRHSLPRGAEAWPTSLRRRSRRRERGDAARVAGACIVRAMCGSRRCDGRDRLGLHQYSGDPTLRSARGN
jgi:hypothetical protein